MKTDIAGTLRKILEETTGKFLAISEYDSNLRPSVDKWSRKEILGHMIDSAGNNHQRFVRGQLSPEIKLGGYEQSRWVAAQGYKNEKWSDLVQLWNAYNLHLAHVIEQIPDSSLGCRCFIGDNEPVTL